MKVTVIDDAIIIFPETMEDLPNGAVSIVGVVYIHRK